MIISGVKPLKIVSRHCILLTHVVFFNNYISIISK